MKLTRWAQEEVIDFSVMVEWNSPGSTGVNERVLSTLLNEMDGIESKGYVLMIGVFWLVLIVSVLID